MVKSLKTGRIRGKVKGLALGDERLDVGPSLRLSSVREKVHDDSTLGDGSVNVKQVLTGDPTVLNGSLPRSTILSDTNNNIDTVVTEVKALAVALRAVTNEGKSVVLKVIKKLLAGPVRSLVNNLFNTTKVDGLEATLLNELRAGDSWASSSSRKEQRARFWVGAAALATERAESLRARMVCLAADIFGGM